MPFLLAGKSLVWKTDGAAQYFPYLYYMGRFLRNILRDMIKGDFALQMFDFSLGMGDDVGAIFRSHPLDFLSIGIPGKYTEYLYHFLTLFRMYLAGISFSLFCFYWKQDKNAVLMGSMIYVFSGYVLVQAIRHPTFLAPMIVLPVLLIGAEQVLRRQNILLFSFMTALGFISNYYFMYMCSIAMAFYVLIRFFDLYKEKRWQQFLLSGARLAAAYLLGVGLVTVVLFPSVGRMMSSERLGESGVSSLLTYKASRYYSWFMNLVAPVTDTGYNTNLNYSVLVLPALVVLFVRKWREHLVLKLVFLGEVIGMLIPAVAFVMSGFSNINNRWIFVLSFTVSFICVTVAEDFRQITKKQVMGILLVSVVYLGMTIGLSGVSESNRFWWIGAVELAVCVMVLLGLQKRSFSYIIGKFLRFSYDIKILCARACMEDVAGQPCAAQQKCALRDRTAAENVKSTFYFNRIWSGILLALVCSSVIVNGYLIYDEKYGGEVTDYLDCGEALDYYADSRWKYYNKIEDVSFYRVDDNQVSSGKENAAVILGYSGISMYNSIVNSNVVEYLLDLESPGVNAVHRVFGMEGRTAAEALANVKYYMAGKNESGTVPYGYVLAEELSGEKYQIYRNEYPLSIGYTYDTWIGRQDYDALTALEKQQMMLEAVVLEQNAVSSQLSRVAEYSGNIVTVPLQKPGEGTNVTVTEKGYKVGEGGGSIFLTYEKKEGYESYLCLKGFYRNIDHSGVNILADGVNTRITLRGKTKNYSLGRTDYTVNLGYSDSDGDSVVEIAFTQTGTYELDAMDVSYVPMENYVQNIEARNRESLQDVVVDKNMIKGTVEVSEAKVMVFSIPCSDGWTVLVDGKQQELQKANVMYLGLELEPGQHEICLIYTTPGVVIGGWITLASWVVFLSLLIMWIKKKLCKK